MPGLCCLLSRLEMGQQQGGHNCMLLWPQCCTDGPGEPECPVASACCPCPRMLAESDWEGAAPQAASCLEGGSPFRCVVGLLVAALPAQVCSASSAVV